MASDDVALLYADEDKGIAAAVAQQLQRAGFSVWWDEDGTAHEELRYERLRLVMGPIFAEAKSVVVLLSERASAAEWLIRVLDLALRMESRLIPCWISDEPMWPIGEPPSRVLRYLQRINHLNLNLNNPETLERLFSVLRLPVVALAEDSVERAQGRPMRPQSSRSIALEYWWVVVLCGAFFVAYLWLHTPLEGLGGIDGGFISSRALIFTGVSLCALGVLVSVARRILELIAAWRIIKRMRNVDRP